MYERTTAFKKNPNGSFNDKSVSTGALRIMTRR